MAKTLCLVVAFLLIFAITEASREQTNQTDGQRPHGRGATRYNSRSTTESSDLPTLETRQPRIKNSRSEVSTLEKHEAHPAGEDSIRTRSKPKQTADSFVTTSRTVSRNSNSNNGNGENSRRRQKSFSTQPPKEERARDAHEIKERKFEPPKRPTASRRSSSDASPVWVDNAKLNHDTATRPPEFLRSRTGRKIYATNGRESKSDASPSEGPPENRSAEKAESLSNEPAKEEIQSGHAKIETATEKELKKVDVKSANNSSSVGDEAKDILLSGSESVRVDVPLTVGNSEDVNFLSAVPSRQASRSAKEKPESNDISRSSAKKGRNSDRSKSRNRSKTRDPNSETSITSRRGTSKASRTEETGRSSGSRHRSNAKSATSRGRTAQKSKDAVPAEARSGRQKNADADFETSANRRTEARRDDRRTSEGKRKSKESRSKTTEAKVDGQQDARAQSRSRSRTPTSNLEITTAYIPKATVTEATTVPFANVETTTFNPTTIRPSTTPRTSSSTERVSRNKGRDRGESSRGKKPPKEDFFNHGLGFRGRKTSTEASASLVADSRTTTARSETQLRGNPGWTLKRRPGHINDATSATTASVPVDRDQTNEIVQTNDARSTEAPLNNTKSGRRGTKRPKAKDESNTISSAKGTTRGSKSFNKSEGFGLPKGTDVESDNYPPAFRARLSQLKNSNLKPTGGKSTTRTSVQATKPSLASLFSERSKMKLELARRLIKPELNVDENDFDVTTDGYSESKSRAKEVSTVSESRNVEKTTKATSKLIGARTTHRNSTTVSLTKEKPTVKGRWKLLETRKLPKDRNAEAPLRPFIATTKKSRVTSERAIEETSARSVTEFAVPRLITVSHRDGILGEKATDATRVRFPTTAASREETSTLPNTVKPLEENSIPTTIEPQKLDKYIETITVASIADAAAEPKVRPTEFFQEVTLPPTVTTPGSTFQLSTLSPTRADKVYPVYVPDGKEFNSLDDGERTTIPSEGRSSVRPRYTKPQQPPEVAVSMVTSVTVGPTSRYIRKKTGVFTPYDAVPKASSTEATPAQTKRRDFRPRTSTYRRHSEVSTAGVTITPKPVKYSAQVTPGVPSPSEPFVNVQVANDTTSPTSGVVESSNGSSGNTNVFNPTRSTYFKANTTNLLEQLRSTVAPLLNNLGEKTPIFSGAYSNVNTANSPARITPNGSPPRFSARYKGAELLVRKPSVGQSVVPSITTSSTTASTPIENSGSAPPVAVSSPGEPRFVTYYQALESASIRNENLGVEDASQRQRLTGAVTKDTTSTTTAQGTAGTRLFRPEQTTQTITTTAPNVMSSTTLSVTNFTTLPASSTSATSTPSAPSSSIESTTIPSLRTTPTETSSRPQFTTSVGSTSETTTVTADINENLVSTETTTDASTARVTTTTATETDDLNTISRMNDGETTTTTTTTTSAAPSTNTTTTARTTVLNRVPPSPSSMPSGSPNTPPYLNRFGGGQVTPRPGSSKAPVRDYLIYGIYPNKTIVRKRPEDNLIDGRNVDSPYVIFGIFPDGRLVRKFPNGTIIPDSPRNPVEVVFTLRTTTTTNRPAPWPYYNQANQAGSYNNQYQAPVFNYGRPVDELAGGAKSPGPLDFGVIGNAIGVTPGGPNFAGPLGPPASVPNANKMSDILLNSQMGAIPNAAFGNQQTSSTGQAQGPAGSSIFQDRERNEASRTRVTSDQRNSVYIGQDKFINYQIDGAPNVNPKVVDVRINSVASSVNEGPASSPAVPSFEGLLNNQSGGGVITAPPGFPWRDPLDQIFGITTNSPIQTASVASNQLDEPTESNASVTSRPLSPLVELFTPAVSSTTAASTTAGVTSTTTASTTTPTSTTTVSTTPTTTTTLAPTTSATTTTTSASTTTTITTTATPRTSTTTLTPSTTASATFTTGTLITIPQLAQAASFINTYAVPYTTTGVGTVPPSSTASTISANNILNRLQTNAAENPFGTTYGDLAFLNSLLQNDVKSTTPKTLSEVEQMLANRILSLALANPGPTRSPKAIQAVSLNTNAIQNRPSGSAPGPIIIDLLPVSSPPSVTSSSTSKRYTEAIPTTRPNSASTITTRAPVVITAKPKTTARPKATSQEPIGFGMGLWRALFSGNLFQTTTAASTVKKPKPSVKATTSKPVTIAQAPAQIQPTLNHVMSAIKSPTTTRSVDISDIHVASSTSLADSIISASTPSTVSTTLLNNPNPRLTDISSSTFSPDEDAKFLAALLRAIQTESATSTSTTARGLSDDDEAFLRAILSNQASIFTTATPSTEANPAALLAMLLKQQGIEPTTPATSLREQLQLSSSTPNAIPTQSTTQPITTIPINTARQVVTPKPSARPRPRPAPQTTTWAPSSTYPPPLFGGDGSSGSGLATATRAIGRFLGAAISGAAQQLQSLLRNSTRSAAG
ncbi:hypothetical protein PUN28_000910 [Cardiocondyla obscurior]|uniref:Uncharacterized protein n=1 Tax=Cardiocondyla obscurior TaxID=286306 RepID=A0AAW2H275_9HYME